MWDIIPCQFECHWPLPSDAWVLLVGVPVEPLMVHKSVGENSGSLIGPLGAKGVSMVEGDWLIPRFLRYNCNKRVKHFFFVTLVNCKLNYNQAIYQ